MDGDATDLKAALAGDEKACARLYDRHAPVVLSLCRRQTWSLEEAEDATLETFLRAFSRLHKVESPEKFGAWMYEIASRVCRERSRAERRRRRHQMNAAEQHMQDQTPAPTPTETAERREQLERLTAALEALPNDQRLAIHVYYLDAEGGTGAASTLGLSHSALYKLLAKAREQLARILREAPLV